MIFTIPAKDKNSVKTIIGDELSSPIEFLPSIKLSRWDGEVSFKVGFDVSAIAKAGRIFSSLGNNTYQLSTPLLGFKIYPLAAKIGMEEGGLEFEIILKSKPPTNKISLPIETAGLEFAYQRPLTKRYSIGQSLMGGRTIATVTETDVIDDLGKIVVHRPENVVGSYAVYHGTRANDYTKVGGKNYRCGKAFHIFRPRLTDVLGKTTWADLNIDELAGKMTITIPQTYLNSAVYPVILDPTFGVTSVGGTGTDASANYSTYLSFEEASPNGTLNSLSYYCKTTSGTGTLDGGFYSSTAAKHYPYQKLTEIVDVAITNTPGWVNFDVVDYGLMAGDFNYWAFSSSDVNHTHYYDEIQGTAVPTTHQSFYEYGHPLPATASGTPTAWNHAHKESVYGIYMGSITKPAMGNPILGAWRFGSTQIVFNKFKAPTTGTVSNISVYINNTNAAEQGVHIAIYSHDAVNNYPEDLLGSSSVHGHQAGSTAGYITVNLSASVNLTADTIYWLAFQFEREDMQSAYWSPYTGNRYCRKDYSWGAFPNPGPDSGYYETADIAMVVFTSYAAGGATYNESIALSSIPACSHSPQVDFFPSLGAFASTPALNRAVSADLFGSIGLASTPALNRAAIADLLGNIGLASTPAASMIGGMDYSAALTLASSPAVSMAYLLSIFPSLVLSSNPVLAASALGNFYNSLTLAGTPAAVMAAVADLFVSLTVASTPALAALGGSDFYESLALSSSPAFSIAVFKAAFGELALLSNPALSATALADLYAAVIMASAAGISLSALAELFAGLSLSSNPALSALGQIGGEIIQKMVAEILRLVSECPLLVGLISPRTVIISKTHNPFVLSFKTRLQTEEVLV